MTQVSSNVVEVAAQAWATVCWPPALLLTTVTPHWNGTRVDWDSCYLVPLIPLATGLTHKEPGYTHNHGHSATSQCEPVPRRTECVCECFWRCAWWCVVYFCPLSLSSIFYSFPLLCLLSFRAVVWGGASPSPPPLFCAQECKRQLGSTWSRPCCSSLPIGRQLCSPHLCVGKRNKLLLLLLLLIHLAAIYSGCRDWVKTSTPWQPFILLPLHLGSHTLPTTMAASSTT
jgi:hypothetical protein